MSDGRPVIKIGNGPAKLEVQNMVLSPRENFWMVFCLQTGEKSIKFNCGFGNDIITSAFEMLYPLYFLAKSVSLSLFSGPLLAWLSIL